MQVEGADIFCTCLPPHCELQYPVRALDEDEGFLSAAVEGGSVYVDEFIPNLQLLAVGGLPCVLDLNTRRDSLEIQETVGTRTGEHSDRKRALRGHCCTAKTMTLL